MSCVPRAHGNVRRDDPLQNRLLLRVAYALAWVTRLLSCATGDRVLTRGATVRRKLNGFLERPPMTGKARIVRAPAILSITARRTDGTSFDRVFVDGSITGARRS